jgi:hypothetical protein
LQLPEAEDNLGSLVTPGQWFYCKFDENLINHTWLPAHHEDQIVVGFHGTSVARALEIAKVGVMEAGPGQSGGRKDVVYFFESKDQSLCNFYQLYSFIDETSPYLWTACLDAMINRNPHHGAGKLNKQRTQPPNTICLMGIHFGAVHVKELLNPSLRAKLRVHNGLFSATDALLQQFKMHKTTDGATWLLDNATAEDENMTESK